MMNINEFIKDYCSMILYPVVENKNYGFKLTSGARIFFEDTKLTHQEAMRLKRHYERRGLTWDLTYTD